MDDFAVYHSERFYFQEFLAQTITKFLTNKWEHMQTICKFSKNMLLKSQKSKQRIVRGYKSDAFAAYLLRRCFIAGQI